MNTELINQTEEFVYKLLQDESPANNVYHNSIHTKEVAAAAEKIAKAEKLSDDEIEILILAALLHDTGYTSCCEGHEQVSADRARKFLEEKNYPAEKIDKIADCILATKMPQTPNNHLEEIICDADLHHLGKKNFKERSDIYRAEYEKTTGKVYSDIDWVKKNLGFLKEHKFFTKYANDNFHEQKILNVIKLEKLQQKYEKKAADESVKKEKVKLQKDKQNRAERGIETMFRNTMRTHVSFSSMADSKANIMISVNTLLLTALVTILSRKLDSNPHLIVPTLILTIVSMTTLIFAVMVTRPTVNAGTFTKEDIQKKKANLLFFGNFFNVPLDIFSWGMKEVINDKDYLYDSMIKDFYFLGQVLGKKYRYLRICYSIFMYGLLLSIFAFAMAIFIYPEGMHPDKTNKVKVEQSDNNNILDILE